MFRLQIDVPLGEGEKAAVEFVNNLYLDLKIMVKGSPETLKPMRLAQYRLIKDEDRRNGNYLTRDSEGHITQKKCKLFP